jgi:hypothetical protein
MCRVNSLKANYRHTTVQLIGTYIMGKHNIKSRVIYGTVLEEKYNKVERQKNEMRCNKKLHNTDH